MSELGAAAAHPDYPMWSSLLRWSLAQGSDGTSASPQGPMSEEKRRFLEGALKAMGEDGAERQRAIFEAVQKFVDGTGDADACVDALEQLEDDAQDLDAARDLLKVGMLGLVLKRSARTTRPSGSSVAASSPWPPRTTPRCRTARAKRPWTRGSGRRRDVAAEGR